MLLLFLYVSLSRRTKREYARDNQLRPYEFLYYFHMSDRKPSKNILKKNIHGNMQSSELSCFSNIPLFYSHSALEQQHTKKEEKKSFSNNNNEAILFFFSTIFTLSYVYVCKCYAHVLIPTQ